MTLKMAFSRAYRLPKLYPELGKTNDCARMLK